MIAAVLYIVALQFCSGNKNAIRNAYKVDRSWLLWMQMLMRPRWAQRIWNPWKATTLEMCFRYSPQTHLRMANKNLDFCISLVSQGQTLAFMECNAGPHQTLKYRIWDGVWCWPICYWCWYTQLLWFAQQKLTFHTLHVNNHLNDIYDSAEKMRSLKCRWG